MRTKRWATVFSQFRLTFVQIKSEKNPADAISRMYTDMTLEQRASVTPAKSDELDDFVLRLTELPANQTDCLPALNVSAVKLNDDLVLSQSTINDVALHTPTPSVSSENNASPLPDNIPIPPPRKRRQKTESIGTDQTLNVNAVITRSMDKPKATVPPAIKNELTSVNIANNTPANAAVIDQSGNAQTSPSADKPGANKTHTSKLTQDKEPTANKKSDDTAVVHKSAKKPSELKLKSHSVPTNNDAQLPYENASLESDSGENGFERNLGIDETEDQINEVQLQSVLDLTVNDYLNCPEFGDIMRYKLSGELSGNNAVDRKTLLIADDFMIVDNLLYRITAVRNKKLQRVRPHLTRLCVPKRFQFSLVEKVHVIFAHSSYEKLSSGLRQRYYFSALNDLAYQIPRTCATCNFTKPSTTPMPPLFPHSHSGKWNDVWSIDHMALPRPTSVGHRYLLIMIEQSTRWPEIVPCFTTSSSETAQHILRHIIANHGPPHALRLDRASTNISKLMHIFSNKFKIKLIPSASRGSQSNGLAERGVLAVKNAIRLLCDSDADIESALGEILIALRSSPSKSMSVSPFFARFGRDFDLLGFNSPFTPPASLTSKDQQFLISYNKHLEAVGKAVKENILESKETMSNEYNQHHRAAFPPYKQGTYVLLHTPLKGNSSAVLSHKPYGNDVFVITEVVQNENYGPAYRIVNTRTGQARKALVPAYRLKLFHSREQLLNKYQPQTGSTVQSDGNAAAANAPQSANAKQRSVSKPQNKSADSSPESPAVRILRQNGDKYLIVREDKSRTWVPRSEKLDTLIKEFLLTRETSRQRRNASRKTKL